MSTGSGLNKWPIIPDVSLANGGSRQRWRLKHALVHFSWSCTSQFLLPCMEVQTGWRHACAILSVFNHHFIYWCRSSEISILHRGRCCNSLERSDFLCETLERFCLRDNTYLFRWILQQVSSTLSQYIYNPHATADFRAGLGRQKKKKKKIGLGISTRDRPTRY